MPLLAIGLNHHTAPVEVREAVAFSPEAQREALPALKRHTGADEVVLVSTCNRSEIYLRGPGIESLDAADHWLRHQAPGGGVDIAPHLYRRVDEAVARHAFRVASGLDSMVLGEPMILGQVKQAVRIAGEAGTLGGTLDRLFQQTFSVAKQVRARTAIGECSVSTAATTLQLARQLYGDLSRVRVLFVGAGEMIERTAVHFAAQAPLEMAVANRTLERGESLAARIGATAMTLADVPANIHRFDAIVSCTASTLPIIGKGMIERALRLRKRRPMFLVDLAVPRDIEPEVGELSDAFLHTLDTLGRITGDNSQRRRDEVAKADAIIDTRAAEFGEWLRSRSVVPLIRRMRASADHDREIELARARKRLANGEDPLRVLEAFGHGLTNKLLHAPMRALNDAGTAEREGLRKAFESLYGVAPTLED
jgi:glutamyl-tRNA reductase